MSPEQLLEIAQKEFDMTDEIEQESLKQARSSVSYGLDALLHDPAEADWGVIFHQNLSNQIKSEIEKLIKHRANYYEIIPKVFEINGTPDYIQFLSNNGVSPGFGEVEKVPCCLLIAGDPTEIPYRFQYELGTECAVGRLVFNDHTGYQAYIDQLISSEITIELDTLICPKRW